jgi:hypothetical protein
LEEIQRERKLAGVVVSLLSSECEVPGEVNGR